MSAKSLAKACLSIGITAIAIEFSSKTLVHYGLLDDLYLANIKRAGIIQKDWNWRNEKMPWGAWHKPNSKDRGKHICFDVTYESNFHGARDSPFDLSTPRQKRTLLVGDSFAEGYGLNKEDTLDSRLEQLTAQDVYNLGSAHGVGPVQYFLIYKNFSKIFAHDNLVITFLPQNDFTDNDPALLSDAEYKYRHRPYFKRISDDKFEIQYPPNSIKTDSLYESKKHTLASFSLASIKSLLIQNSSLARVMASLRYRQRGVVPLGYYNGASKERVNAVKFYIDEMLSFAEKQDVKRVLLFVIPGQFDIDYFKTHKYKPKWLNELNMLEKKNSLLKVIDGLDHFSDPSTQSADFFLPCDGHWNAKGAALAAEAISRHLE